MSKMDRLVPSSIATADFAETAAEISSWLTMPAVDLDRKLGDQRDRIVGQVASLNQEAVRAGAGSAAQYSQQLLLARIYQTVMRIPDGESAEGSVLLHEITRMLETATTTAEDLMITPGMLDSTPSEPKAFLSWLKDQVREHRAFKHPYYAEFIRDEAQEADLRKYVIQESLVDGRFDDFLAMMQIGTAGASKMEIAGNFWDEMGNGDPEQVHTYLFNKIYEVFDISPEEMEDELTASDLLGGNLAVLLCRYRHLYPEAVGYLGMTEWLAPDRFKNVVHAWERLGLPKVGITYHRLHITIDSQHAAGWFHNVVIPSAGSPAMRRGITRGSMWRINSSARILDDRLGRARDAHQDACLVR
ncbi:iron-containing redox enzyme family protein [Actinocrispum wychmicini]|uniref:Heme oxygenase-like protein n=1 Tax=Actinocrispum wychmicini TaxID=1213861 RepID=A0A4R2JRI1_9PSEU|nr:iron-containing redox enzyme family protein [Actinocrispum wychmicini]TCO62861.1 heme oxygenase-like protein [Actinocrispum wychmicini]